MPLNLEQQQKISKFLKNFAQGAVDETMPTGLSTAYENMLAGAEAVLVGAEVVTPQEYTQLLNTENVT